MGQSAPLQSAPADGKDLRARQFAVLADRASHPPAAPRARSAPSRIVCPPTWSSPIRSTASTPRKSGASRTASFRRSRATTPSSRTGCCSDGKLNFYWIQVNNNLQAAPNSSRETYPGYRNPDNFIVVSDAYPTVTAMAADLVLPAAMWVEKEGAYGNAERRTHVWRQLVNAPGEARSDLWQMMEFSKRFTTDEVWPAQILDRQSQLPRQDAVRRTVPQRQGGQVPGHRNPRRLRKPRSESFRLLRAERAVRGIRRVRPRPWPRPGGVRHPPRGAGVAMACRRRQGNEVALSRRP